MKILALDPATQCGWAHSSGELGSWDLSAKRNESAGIRLFKIRMKLDEIRGRLGVDLLFFEAALHSGKFGRGALCVQSEIQGVIKLWCEDNKVDYKGFSSTEIKKHATGKGRCGKDDMVSSATKKWGLPFEDEDAVDALWILDFGLMSLGFQDVRSSLRPKFSAMG